MIRYLLKFTVVCVVSVLCFPIRGEAQVEDLVFQANTEHELHVYRVFGDEPGNTIMIIGGIQGDEPSG